MGFLFLKKQTITNTENKIGALRVQSSSQGLPIPIVFGKTRLSGNLLWYGDFTAIPHTETQTSGGKGGGGVTTTNTTFTYTAGIIIGLMEGPSVAANFIGQVWKNKDVTTPVALGLSEFTGSYTQSPWAYMTTNHPTEALGYRGTAYVAHAALDLGSSDGLPNLSFEVTGLLAATDVNPAAVLSAILTSDKFGAGWPAAQLGSLTDFTSYCAAAGFLVSPAYTAQRPASDLVAELCVIGNAAPVWSEGLLKIKTYADTTVGAYTPDLTVQYALTYADFIAPAGEPPVRLTRKRQADAFNQVQVECLDRANQYNPYIAEAKDQWNIDAYGLRPMEPIEAHAICDANVARSVAQTLMQRELYVRNAYAFTVGWRYGRLEPMDIVSLTDPLLGLAATRVRIVSIDEAEETGELEIVAEELNIGVSTPGSYATQATSGSTPAAGISAGNTYAPVIFQPPLAMTAGQPQVWIGAQGALNWGGAEVHVSTDGGASYGRVGALTGPARYGVLAASFAVGVDPDVTNTLSVNLTVSRSELTDATAADADALVTLSYVDGEIIAYSNTSLGAQYQYTLDTRIRRGQGGSTIGAHLTGTKFMRLDEAVAGFDVSPSLYGTTLYIKLLSYNTQGGALQSLADVAATPFLLVAQAATGAAGFSYIADRSTANVADPGPGKLRFNNALQSAANTVALDALTNDGANMVAYFASVGNAGQLDVCSLYDTKKWATYSLTSSNAPAGYQTFGVVYRAGGVEIPNNETVILTFSPAPGVTSVGLTLPSLFVVSNSPVTSAGNLTAALATQTAATVLAGPLTGNAAAPAFRALGGGDMPRLTINTQTSNYTLALADANVAYVRMNSANATVVTVPSNANAAFATGSSVLVSRAGAGSVTISAQANVTVSNASSNTARVQNSVLGLIKTGTDTWDIFGDTT